MKATQTKRGRSALDATTGDRKTARERLTDLAQRAEAARVGLLAALDQAEAQVLDAEGVRRAAAEKQMAERTRVVDRAQRLVADAQAKADKRIAAAKQTKLQTIKAAAEQHRRVSEMHDELMRRLAKARDTLA